MKRLLKYLTKSPIRKVVLILIGVIVIPWLEPDMQSSIGQVIVGSDAVFELLNAVR